MVGDAAQVRRRRVVQAVETTAELVDANVLGPELRLALLRGGEDCVRELGADLVA